MGYLLDSTMSLISSVSPVYAYTYVCVYTGSKNFATLSNGESWENVCFTSICIINV